MAQHHGNYYGDRGHYYHGYNDGGRYSHGYNDGGRYSRGYNDEGCHYGYYRSSSGELVFGLLGLGVLAAVVSASDRPVYVERPVVYRESPQVIYIQQPVMQPVVIQSQTVYQQPEQVIQQPIIVQQPAQPEPPQPLTMTINIQNSNGSFTPVLLRQVGTKWVGPKGEYYDNLPSVGQLRPIYGF